MKQNELILRKKNHKQKSINELIARTTEEIYKLNPNSDKVYEIKPWDNSSMLLADILNRVLGERAGNIFEKADFCPSFYEFVLSQALHKTLPLKTVNKSEIQRGDMVFMGMGKYPKSEHCAIVVDVNNDLIDTIEWDTSYNFAFNGGQLMKRTRLAAMIVNALRIDESKIN